MSGTYSSGIRKVVPRHNKISPAFYYCWLKSKPIQMLINAHAVGTTILHAGSSVKYMKILVPTDFILKKFNLQASECFVSILKLQKQNQLSMNSGAPAPRL